MKKTISFFVFICAFVAFTKAQTTFDVFTYTEPKGYTKELKDDIVSYIKYNKNKTTFCQIGLYSAVNTKGTVSEIFTSEWKSLIATPYKTTTNPPTENLQDINGWKAISGAANYTFDGTQRAALLFCFTNNEKQLLLIYIKKQLGQAMVLIR